jgi:hypothetical protein
VSSLLVAFIPGLLMLATLGLDRLEAGLTEGTVSPDDVPAVLARAKADLVRKPLAIRDTTPPGTLPLRETWLDGYATTDSDSGLPTRIYVHHRSNPQFQPTRQADRV